MEKKETLNQFFNKKINIIKPGPSIERYCMMFPFPPASEASRGEFIEIRQFFVKMTPT